MLHGFHGLADFQAIFLLKSKISVSISRLRPQYCFHSSFPFCSGFLENNGNIQKSTKKARVTTGFFAKYAYDLGMDCIYWTGIYACAAVDTGISVYCTLATLLADAADGAGIFTCCTVCTIVCNGMSHNSPPYKNELFIYLKNYQKATITV